MDIIELFRYKIYNLRLKLYVKSEIFFPYLYEKIHNCDFREQIN